MRPMGVLGAGAGNRTEMNGKKLLRHFVVP